MQSSCTQDFLGTFGTQTIKAQLRKRASILCSHFLTLSLDGTREMPSLVKQVSTPRISSGLPHSSFLVDTASDPRQTFTNLARQVRQLGIVLGASELQRVTLRSTA